MKCLRVCFCMLLSTCFPAPPPAPQSSGGGSMLGSIGSTIAQGMAFGTGSAIAHKAIDSIMGGGGGHAPQQAAPAPAPAAAVAPELCAAQKKSFEDCLNSNGSDVAQCQFYFDMLKQCRSSAGSSLNL
eukprot:jgi/Mesvir1/23067/Mv10594-RA.1